MDNNGNLAIYSGILLISFILIAATAFSVFSSNTTTNGTSEAEIEQMLDEALDSITKYIQISDQVGRYYGPAQQQRIQKIGIMIKPLITSEIDISELTIKISNGDSIRILSYSNQVKTIGNNKLFDHPIWNNITENTFGLVVTHDKDNSLVSYDTINKNTDMAYIIIKLSPDYYMKKGDTMIIQLFPSSGITRTILIEAPLPMKPVVSFD